MKSDTYVLVMGLMITALANLPEIQSQDVCFFYFETQTIPNGATQNAKMSETELAENTILILTTSNGSVTCSDIPNIAPFSKYIKYSHTEDKNLKFAMKQEIGDDLDDGLIKKDEPYILLQQCTLICPQEQSIIIIAVTINPENTQSPKFSTDSAELTLEENYPKGLDFSYLLKVGDKSLSVSDKDLPYQNIIFDVSDQRFEALTANRIDYNDSNGNHRITYEPRIAVKLQLNSADSPIKFNLIAKDSGNPQKESVFPITVNINPQDARDPEFEMPYYTSIILNSTFKGILEVKPKNILANDGDKMINIQLRYEILENGGLNVKLKNPQPAKGVPIEIELINEVEGSSSDKMRYVVIKATQIDDVNRFETVVLVVELPQPMATTTTTTMSTSPSSSTTTTTMSTCSPCPTTTTTMSTCPPSSTTTSTSSEAITTPSCATCPPCTTTSFSPDASTSCPTFDPTTDCPMTTGSHTGDPVTPTDPQTSPTTIYSTTTSPIFPNNSTTTTYTTTSVTPTETGTMSNSSNCPATTCPTECPTCPTENTIVPCSPSTTEFPPTTVTCPTTAVPPVGNSTVQFEKQQYASEILENSPVNTFIVTLRASSTSNEKLEYSIVNGNEAKYFEVNSKTGNVSTAKSLPVGDYLLDAIAQIPSGDKDHTRIVIKAVVGTSCNGTQFSSPLYEFPVVERTTGKVGQVQLRSNDNDNYTLSISSCNPKSMADYFDVDNNGTIVVINQFNWTYNNTRIILTISAENQINSRIIPISTIVNIDVLDINEAPQFLDYASPLLVGYPDRTYFDPSVQMPILTVKANDADKEENATLTYHVLDEFEVFDIDLLTGSLFVKGLDNLNWETSRTVKIVARDSHGLNDTLSITVKPLSDNFIILMKAKSQSDSLTEETVVDDMSRILGYNVVVLRLEKSPDLSGRVTQSESHNYKVTLYALNKTTFITREEFIQKENQANFTGLSWTMDALSAPQEYQVEKMIDTLTKQSQSYTIATAVLGTLLGLMLILIVVYVFYVKKFKVERPWSQAFRAASLKVDKKHWDQRSFAQSSDQSDQTSEAQVENYNKELSGKSNESSVTPAIRFSMEKTFISDNIQPPQSSIEDEAYCPPTPVPKKSILKDPNVADKNGKQGTNAENKLADAGVKFSSNPEVITVAATVSEMEVDLGDDDDDLLIEEL